MGRKRSFHRGGPGKKKRKRRNLVEINEKAKKHMQKELEKKKLQAQRSEGVLEKSAPQQHHSFQPESSSESEEETSAYDELLSSLRGGERIEENEDSETDDDTDEEDVIEEEFAVREMEGRDGDVSDEEIQSDGKEQDERQVKDEGDDDNEDDDNEDDDGVGDIDGVDDEVEKDFEEEQESDEDVEDDDDGDDGDIENQQNNKDPFFLRVNTDLPEKDVEELKTKKLEKVYDLKWPTLGQLILSSSCKSRLSIPDITKDRDYQKLHIRKRLFDQWPSVNKECLVGDRSEIFSPLQRELFSIMNNYMDLVYTEETHENSQEIRKVYCLHVINHVVKTRNTVLKHNSSLSINPAVDSEDFRDQGLTRPKALFIVPFRHSVVQLVQTIIDLLLPKGGQHVSHKKRFSEEYGDKYAGKVDPKKPEDWQKTFAGNIDDHFKIGISLSKKSLKLYTPFYQSDIIIASPLGLRTIIGSKGDKQQDYDFLSSLEILVMDQTDIFLMQNWEHVLHILDYMHLQPKDSHGVDFSRVRMWALNGWSKFFRQTLLFSQLSCPEIKAVVNKHCKNFAGLVSVTNPTIDGAICQVATQLQQVFHRMKVDSFISDADERFKFFTTKILPRYKDALLKGTVIFIPSYFDYVRVRNYFRREGLNFCQVCEYSSSSEVSRVKQYMTKGSRHFLLYTERFHFFQRILLRGLHHIIFYQLPTYPHFYSEFCNMLQNLDEASDITCCILYSKYDTQRMARVVGMKRFTQMLQSPKDVHMLISGEND